jgi:hypothetical protein
LRSVETEDVRHDCRISLQWQRQQSDNRQQGGGKFHFHGVILKKFKQSRRIQACVATHVHVLRHDSNCLFFQIVAPEQSRQAATHDEYL